jgi:RNA polymerase sigma-70 factor (ECF subfamily)
MESARRAAARPAGAVLFRHLEAVTPRMDARRLPTHDELNEWMQSIATTAARPAFAALFRHFAPRIKGYLVRSGSDEALAEELAQETMVVLWRRAASFDPSRAQLSTWLYTIARNLRIDHLRRVGAANEGRESRWDADQQPASAHLEPDELLLAAQRERGVQRALAELGQEQALLLRLSFFEEQPHSRIAQELNIPLGTVKSRIRLALDRLRRNLDRYKP